MASGGGKMLSAEERRRQKELEEARKAGLAAPEVDEEGNAINPHIPQFMASAPWYLNDDRPSLKHQKNWKGSISDDKAWYERGVKVFQATKYRKGACENCGSMSHKTKDCMERPRSKGAKWTGKGIAPDEKVQDVSLASFDAKRDRWNGYSAEDWVKQAETFEKVAELRAEVRRRELLDKKFEGEAEEADEALEVEEEDKVHEEEEGGFAKIEKRVRSAGGGPSGTVRNLRIREDTAKYLLNLDVNSAYYDPKSRSMREDPNPDKDPAEKNFAGDFVRATGSTDGFGQLNLFSVTAYEKGQDVHLQATPSQAEAAFRAFQAKKAALKGEAASSVLKKYGNVAEKPTEEMLALQGTEAYVEYDAAGRVIRGQERKAHSRYEEDVYPGNHRSVWGSWWKDGTWGYACCHQTSRNAYCTGAAGAQAVAESDALMQSNMAAHQNKEKAVEARETEGGSHWPSTSKKVLEGYRPGAPGVWGSEAEKELVDLDEEKLRIAIAKAEAEDREGSEDRKRRYNSLHDSYDVSAEDMEAYRLKKSRGDDPLSAIEAAKAAQKHGDGYGFV